MSFLSDFMLGSRPDYRMMGGMDQYVRGIQEAGIVRKPKSVKFAKRDLKAARGGRIEEMGRLRPVLSAIRARGASDYQRAEGDMRREMAFEDNPTLRAAMLGEIGARINQNQGRQFAEAAAGAYGDAERELSDWDRWKGEMRLRSAMGAGQLAQGSMYDARREGGWLQQAMTAGIGALTGGLGSAIGGGKKSVGSPPLGGI